MAFRISGGDFLPNSASGRTFICSWWFFCIIVVATYGGSLIAYLTISKIDAPFDDLEGLVRQDSYKWGFKEGTVYYDTFKVWQVEISVKEIKTVSNKVLRYISVGILFHLWGVYSEAPSRLNGFVFVHWFLAWTSLYWIRLWLCPGQTDQAKVRWNAHARWKVPGWDEKIWLYEKAEAKLERQDSDEKSRSHLKDLCVWFTDKYYMYLQSA